MSVSIIILIICLTALYILSTADSSKYTSDSRPISPFTSSSPSSSSSSSSPKTPPYTPPSKVVVSELHNNVFMSDRVDQEITSAILNATGNRSRGRNKNRNGAGRSFVKSPVKDHVNKVININNWFVVKHAQDQISEAEKIIAAELDRYRVDWYREVAFEGLRIDGKGYARYDFLLVTPKGIHLIEYDGRAFHSTDKQRRRDLIKDEFCQQHNIPLTRYNRKHYYHLPKEISHLLASYNINKKAR